MPFHLDRFNGVGVSPKTLTNSQEPPSFFCQRGFGCELSEASPTFSDLEMKRMRLIWSMTDGPT